MRLYDLDNYKPTNYVDADKIALQDQIFGVYHATRRNYIVKNRKRIKRPLQRCKNK